MSREKKLHETLLTTYRRAGKEVGYWAHYFLRSVRKNGGLATAKRMLRPTRDNAIQKGLQALIDAGRADLSVEYTVLRPEFSVLFTSVELAEAKRRLTVFPEKLPISPSENFPETLPEGRQYAEGAVRKVTINSYERDPNARKICLKKLGHRCVVCGMSFVEVYGGIGKGFIHVHHKKPLATMRQEYKIDPVKDLVPVCPNCHAMLHTSDPPLAVEELKGILEGNNQSIHPR